MAKNELSFEDYNYKKAKRLLPDGYEPLESISIESPKQEELVKVIKYSSEEEAIKRLNELYNLYPSNNYQILPYNVEVKDFAVIAPKNCVKYLKKNEKVVEDKPLIKVNNYEPFVYRFLSKKQFEDDFFNDGKLLLSTFKRCKTKEVKNRQDTHETQNKFVISDGNSRVETVIGIEPETLLLCTSLSQKNSKKHFFSHKQYGFKIKNLSVFCDILTRALVSKGIGVCELIKGTCVYNDKQINIDATGSGIIESVTANNGLNFGPLMQKIQQEAYMHIIMNKPPKFTKENEYRIAWFLSEPICKDKISDDVILNKDGSIFLYVPELIPFCERI